MTALDFFDPNQVQASLGSSIMGGFAQGSMIEIEPMAERFNNVVGTQGDVGIARISNPLYTVKIKLLQTSATNDDLSALRTAAATATASGVSAPLSIADMSGTTRLSGKCWIQKDPSVGFSDTVETREWTLTVKVDKYVIGGNNAVA